ncbi:MAG: DUF1127 domain-containing protein [Reyranellaceae bacterium]
MSSTSMHPTTAARAARHAGASRGNIAVRLLVAWFNMRAKQRSRRQLGELDARLLRDIGIDRATAHEEARRSVWQ